MSDQKHVRITLRLPKGVHDKVVKMAATERRSLNTQIVKVLEDNTTTKKAA